MRKRAAALATWILAAALAPAAPTDPYQKLAYQVKPAVIRVVAIVFIQFSHQDANGVRRNSDIALGGTGSGFIFHSDGYIVTNGHVIDRIYWYENNPASFIETVTPFLVEELMKKEGAVQAAGDGGARGRWMAGREFSIQNHKTLKKVILSNGEMADFEIKRYSQTIDANGKDVGILKIERSNLPVVRIGDSGQVEIQEEIQTFGFPGAADLNGIMGFYLNPKSSLAVTINRGRISSKKQDFKGVPLIQTDAAIAHGSSGGPAINRKGEVIGVTTYMGGELGEDGQFTQVQGINFLIPVNTVREFIRDVGVEVNLGSEFNEIYFAALEAMWGGNWFLAQEKVEAALALLNDSPDLKELKEKIAIRINGMSAFEKLWMQNKALLLIVLGLLMLVALFVLLLVRSRRREASSASFLPAPRPGPAAARPMPAADATLLELAVADKTVQLHGSVDLMINEKKEGRFPVTDTPLIVGRDPMRANILIQDPIVSKVHCTVYIQDGVVRIKDNNSTNGIFSGDRRLADESLKDGDVVWLGRKGTIKLVFIQ